MNRKNTILIAVVINAGLLALLFVAALTMQEAPPQKNTLAKEEPIELQLPKFDDASHYQELASLTLPEAPKALEKGVEESAFVHKLPPMVAEPLPVQQSAHAELPPAPLKTAPALLPVNEVVVKKGDSLEKIAKINHTSVDEIIKLNHLPSTFLKVGQVLKLPQGRLSVKAVEKQALEVGPEYYIMKVGENPWGVAQKHHMKLDELLRLNGLNEEKARKLKPGDRLRIR
jgi:peptidoglycan endopeptidase LytF